MKSWTAGDYTFIEIIFFASFLLLFSCLLNFLPCDFGLVARGGKTNELEKKGDW